MQSPAIHADAVSSDTTMLVHDSRLDMDIPFLNKEEAKLACLALTHNYPIYMIDLFFEILLDGVEVDAHITPEDIASVYEHAAAYRADLAIARELATRSLVNCSSVAQKFSRPIILDLVLDELNAQRDASIAKGTVNNRGIVNKYNVYFKNMSLVHRSWTIPCQRALGRSFVIFTGSAGEYVKIRALLCSPLFGRWTKQAFLRISGHDNSTWRRIAPQVITNMSVQEGLILGKVALTRYSGLHILTLALDTFHPSDFIIAEATLECVHGLHRLQEFTLDVGGSYALLVRLCHILPSLRCLRRLIVVAEGRDWDIGRVRLAERDPDMHIPPITSDVSPARALKHVTISISGLNSLDLEPVLPIIKWIVSPRVESGFTIDDLKLYYHSLSLLVGNGTALPIIDAVASALRYLDSLELHTSLVDKAPDHNMSRTIFERCKTMRRLRVCFTDGSCPPNFNLASMNCRPASLEKIEVSTRSHYPFSVSEAKSCQFRVCQNPASSLSM